MGMTLEQLVEYALIEAFPGQSQNQKQAYRFEIESFVPQALLQLGQEVAGSPDYQMLQRTVVLPILSTQEIDYDRFGSGSSFPIIDDGFVFGNANAFAISSQRLTLSGSPLLVRNQYLEWQFLTVKNNACVGVLPFFPTDADALDITFWKDLLRVGTLLGTGDVFANGVHYVGVFVVNPGDYFRFQWDSNGDLFITQFDVNRTVISLDYPVVGGQVDVVSTPAVLFTGSGGQVSIGRIGTGSSTSTTPALVNGLYRLDLPSSRQFLTSYFDESGIVQFDGTTKLLSWVPSLSYRGQTMRCDQWYWTFDGEQLVFWPGSDRETLPSNNLRITGNIVPSPVDLPIEYHKRVIDLLVEKARMRAGMKTK